MFQHFSTTKIIMLSLSLGVVGTVPMVAHATAHSNYVHATTGTRQLTVYPQLPTARKHRTRPFRLSVTSNLIFHCLRQTTNRNGTYLLLSNGHQLGWVAQQQLAPLTHVSAKGQLEIYRHQRFNHPEQLQLNQPSVTAQLTSPTTSQQRSRTITLTSKQLHATHLTVQQKIWTDLGQYYLLTNSQGQRYWVLSTSGQLKAVQQTRQPQPTKSKKPSLPTKKVTPVTPKTPTKQPTSPTTPIKSPTTVATPPTSAKLSAATALQQINALMTTNHFMGTLLITNHGPAGTKIMTYGQANLTTGQANTPDEVYPLASLEKSLTGAVVQHLINQHRLTMATTLDQFYPQIPYANTITIRQLLDHTSGIRMGEPVPATALTNETDQVNYTINNLTSTNQHVWSYSNANFTLLAGIVAKVTGRSFMANLQADVLTPLKLQHTFLYDQIPANVVQPQAYTLKNGQSLPVIRSTNLLSSELGCGNVYASVNDFYTFINSLVTGKLLTSAGYQQLADHLQPKYSGGIYYSPTQNLRIGGADNGYRSYYVGTPDGQIAVTLFANQGNWKVGNQVDLQIEQILKESKTI